MLRGWSCGELLTWGPLCWRLGEGRQPCCLGLLAVALGGSFVFLRLLRAGTGVKSLSLHFLQGVSDLGQPVLCCVSCTFFFNTLLLWLWAASPCTPSVARLALQEHTWQGRSPEQEAWLLGLRPALWEAEPGSSRGQRLCLRRHGCVPVPVLTNSCGSCGTDASAEVSILL